MLLRVSTICLENRYAKVNFGLGLERAVVNVLIATFSRSNARTALHINHAGIKRLSVMWPQIQPNGVSPLRRINDRRFHTGNAFIMETLAIASLIFDRSRVLDPEPAGPYTPGRVTWPFWFSSQHGGTYRVIIGLGP
jgi:hypothetical protein